MFLFLYSKFVFSEWDSYGVEYEDNYKVLISTPSSLVTYEVPSECEVISGGESYLYSSFYSCRNSIKHITFSENSQLKSIYPYVFQSTTLESIDFTPCQYLLEINYSIFYLSKLQSIELPPNLEIIHAQSFRSCTQLTSITIPDSVTKIEGMISNDFHASFYGCSLTNVFISNSSQLTDIGSDCFRSNYLTTFNIPPNLTNLAGAVFLSNPIQYFTISEENQNFTSIGPALLSADRTKLYYVGSSNEEKYIIPKTITYIVSSALRGCTYSEIEFEGSTKDMAFGVHVFSQSPNLKKVTFPSDSYYVEKQMFYQCPKLETVIFKGKLKRVKESSFESCISLKEFNFTNIIKIDKRAFFNTSLTNIVLPSTATELNEQCFAQIKGLTISCENNPVYMIQNDILMTNNKTTILIALGNVNELVINEELTTIQSYAFQNTSIQRVSCPETCTNSISLGESVFSNCDQLTSVQFKSISSIGKQCFQFCSNLETVEIESGTVSRIYEYTFADCSKLISVVFPSTINQLDSYAFRNTYSLNDVNLEHIIVILEYCFLNSHIETANLSSIETLYPLSFQSSSLKTLFLGELLDEVSSQSFISNSELQTVSFSEGLTSIGIESFSECISLEEIIIPKSVKKIQTRAFYHCSQLRKVSFSKDSEIECIYGQAFLRCPLTEYTTDPNDKNIIFEDGVLLTINKTNIISYLSSNTNSIFIVPSKITTIIPYAFEGATYLKKFIIPDGTLTSIGYNAFHDCSNLEMVVIPSSVKDIGVDSFKGCNNLRCIIFGGNDQTKQQLITQGKINENIFVHDCPDIIITCKQNVYYNSIIFFMVCIFIS